MLTLNPALILFVSLLLPHLPNAIARSCGGDCRGGDCTGGGSSSNGRLLDSHAR